MRRSLDYLEGRKFCVVFVKVLDVATERVQLRCLRGRASIEKGHINVVAPSGNLFTVPGTAMSSVMPNDGTALLKDAEYFCLVKVDENIELVSEGSEGIVY
ncbi:MAG: hypothetical protein GX927_05620 [Lentisphaerae bacterium]|jgi:hypothetical protein|nr:hypothetical protein [Lentisphaerota bacterium]